VVITFETAIKFILEADLNALAANALARTPESDATAVTDLQDIRPIAQRAFDTLTVSELRAMHERCQSFLRGIAPGT
jgi:hypothetical protein